MAQATVRLTGSDAGELPAAFCATTMTLTVLPDVSPVNVQDVGVLWQVAPLLAATR